MRTIASYSLFTMLCCVHSFASAGAFETMMENFVRSDFVFQKSASNAPFPPLAYLAINNYSDTQLKRPDRREINFEQYSISQALVVPWLLDKRDAIFVGEWFDRTHLNGQDPRQPDLAIDTWGLPLGWIRQVNPRWQAAAFAMPLAHRADSDEVHWSYEVMAGGFARYVPSDTLWWGFGLFTNADPQSTLTLPYLGFSWAFRPEWTLSAIMPWPGISYSPTANTTLRLGVSPAGTAWSHGTRQQEVYYSWGSWNLGLTWMQRLTGNWWLETRAGVSGLRSFHFEGGDWESPNWQSDDTSFIGLGLSWRP